MTLKEILALITIIKNETKLNANTAQRIGTALTHIVNFVKDSSVYVPEEFDEDIPVILNGSKTAGRLSNGMLWKVSGMTPIQAIKDMVQEYLNPTITGFSTSQLSTIVEVGTTLSGSIQFSFALSNSGNLKPGTLSVIDVTSSTVLVSDQPLTSPVAAAIGNVKKTANGAVHSWQARAKSTQETDIVSNNFSVTWLNKIFHTATYGIPSTSDQVRALTAVWRSQTTLSVNINKPNYVVCVPTGMSIKSAITASFEDITAEFRDCGNVDVVMPDGETIVNYTIFKYQKPVALGATATIILQ